MADVPEFRGNFKAFRNDLLVDKAAEEIYPAWKENFEQWKKVGSDRPYHYFGSVIWYTRIGHVAGRAMLEMLSGKQRRDPSGRRDHGCGAAGGGKANSCCASCRGRSICRRNSSGEWSLP